jgi:cytochrome c oxidase subunit 3
MTITLLFMAVLMIVVAWWLLKQSLDIQPWEAQAVHPSTEDFKGRSFPQPDAKIGLFVFLAVVTSLFSLFISAYMMRMELGDWRPLSDPNLLWLNTGALVFSSIALQWARVAAKNEQVKAMRYGLIAGGFFAFVFLGGQLLAWQQLVDSGYLAQSNPANAFFYLITGLHALHLLGGLAVWSRTTFKLLGGVEATQLRLSIELCAVYWHFLLVMWVVLFGLLLST